MSTSPIEVRLSIEVIVPGTGPVVILGANGSGKTRLGTKLADLNNALRVPGHRNLVFGSFAVSPSSAGLALAQQRTRWQTQPWELATDVDYLVFKMMADTSTAALAWDKERVANPDAPPPPPAPLARVSRLWTQIFPGKELEISWQVEVQNKSGIRYPAQQMSDGERSALYLALHCFDALPGIVIVDEPTIHMHGELARRFWNAVEAGRTDCRFLYITHDVDFALSRRHSRIAIKREDDERVELLPETAAIPGDVLAAVIGAASFSVVASRIVLCEGDASGEDQRLYSAWFEDQDTVVVPLGTCTHVTDAYATVSAEKLVKGANFVPIVDRDDGDDEYLEQLRAKGVFVLRVSEVEGLYCLTKIVNAVARHLNKVSGSIFDTMRGEIRNRIKGASLNRLALERTKRAIRHQLTALIDPVSPDADLAVVQSKLADALKPANWPFDPAKVLVDEKDRIEAALGGDWDADVLRLIHGKDILGVVAGSLGVKVETYTGIVVGALGGGKEYEMIRDEIATALEPHLPPRSAKAS